MNTRIQRLQAVLEERGLDALLVSAPGEEGVGWDNRYYLSGFSGSTGVLLVTRTGATLAVDFRYVEQARNECGPNGIDVFEAAGPRSVWFGRFFAEGGAAGRRTGVSTRDLTYAGYLSVARAVDEMAPDDRPELVPAAGLIEGLRRVKGPEELPLLERAVAIADTAFGRLERALEPGMTEREAAALFAREVRDAGGDDISFPTIIAAGAAGAMPHAQPGDTPLGEGRPIVCDLGARVRGYCSDLTRTVVLGEPDARFREIYAIVYEAQRTAIAGVEPGMRAADADALARDVIVKAGYGDEFGHGLGHGVGLAVHEAPYLGGSSEDVLEEGMAFTIEPGIYLPGWGGVRIEDVVVLEGGRARVLSHARKMTPAGV